jgi:transcription elongation factor Elf1
VIDFQSERERRQPPKAAVPSRLSEPGTVCCHRCGAECLVALPAREVGSTATCPVCGDATAHFEPFELALEWVPVPMIRTR